MDAGSFHEFLGGWGKSVVTGRGLLGGMPVGVIAVETRATQRNVPADPAVNTSIAAEELSAGQVSREISHILNLLHLGSPLNESSYTLRRV